MVWLIDTNGPVRWFPLNNRNKYYKQWKNNSEYYKDITRYSCILVRCLSYRKWKKTSKNSTPQTPNPPKSTYPKKHLYFIHKITYPTLFFKAFKDRFFHLRLSLEPSFSQGSCGGNLICFVYRCEGPKMIRTWELNFYDSVGVLLGTSCLYPLPKVFLNRWFSELPKVGYVFLFSGG